MHEGRSELDEESQLVRLRVGGHLECLLLAINQLGL